MKTGPNSYATADSATIASTMHGIDDAAQQVLDAIQQQQENAVNAGHRPDAAVTYILRMEQQRERVNRAARSFINMLSDVDGRTQALTDALPINRL